MGFQTLERSRAYAPTVGYVVLGIAASWGVFALVSLAPAFFDSRDSDGAYANVEGRTLAHSLPVSISIPSIQLEASFEDPVGVAEDGTVEVPDSFDTVAWYKHGPTPGELGPAVVLGHVDSLFGTAVFYRLERIQIGDTISIKREDGSTATFTVERFERYGQDDFPTEEVYGNISYAGLRLVTCAGTYDKETLRFSHNLVVYARLVEEEVGE